jgi:hypothetical protein
MGSMSASDAAPLPRLGEVFFDVRGESRTMRLSWYADTGVAVFSIWQGGTCTGTFRLPIADLPRMVEALRRGPHGHGDQVTGEQPGSREPLLPAAPAPPGPAAPSRPELLDRDIETGQTTAALHAPQAGPDQTGYQAGPDQTGYQAGPDQAGYPVQPEPAGYPGGPEPAGYPGGPDMTGYQARPEPPGYQAGPPGPPGGYRDQPAAGDTGYQTSLPPRAGSRGKAPRRRRGSPPAPAVPPEAGPEHRDRDLAGDPGEYPAGLAPSFPDEYPAGPPAADFTAPRGSRHRGRARDEDPGGYFDEPLAPGLPHEYPGEYGARPEASYPGEDLEDYPAEPGYLDEEGVGGYQAGPGYLEEQDYPEYPDELPASEYGPPARPYPADAPGTDELFTDGPPEPAKRRGRRRAEPSPESFPYGPPPGGGGSGQRERYPQR